MATKSSTGHSINIANFEQLIKFCSGYNEKFNPSKATLTIAGMQTLFVNAQKSDDDLKAAKTAFQNATNARETAFDAMKKLSTRIINALGATDATQQTKDDANAHRLKINGKRATLRPAKVSAQPESNMRIYSTAQLSYDALVDNFAKLVQTVSAEPLYIPNEEDLKSDALKLCLADLKAKNSTVAEANTAISNMRIVRNSTLYNDVTGLVPIAFAAKQYVKSIFGASSPQFKQVSAVKFNSLD
jgi:hypothetical protein